MLDKDTKRSPWRLLCLLILLLLIALLLAFCSNDRFKQTVCNGICSPSSDENIFVLVNQAKVGGSYKETPYSKLLFKNKSGGLMSPRDAKWGMAADSEDYVAMKTRDLDRACFSETEYPPSDLSKEILTMDEIAIRVLDFGEDGSLESYELNFDPFTYVHPRSSDLLWQTSNNILLPGGVVPNTQNNFRSIKEYLSELTTIDVNSLLELRNMPDDTPTGRTPYHQGFTKNYTGTNGFIYFYILVDDRIKFAEDTPAMYAHVANSIHSLYSPYFQEEVEPKQTGKPHMLALRFYRYDGMVDLDSATGEYNCKYPYDIAVIADGQDDYLDNAPTQIGSVKVETPLLVDPDTGTRGSAP